MPHPYTTTVHGLNTLIDQLRSAFPDRLTPETLRMWNIGRSNESSLLATLRFLGVLDEDRNTLPAARRVFSQVDDDDFADGFARMVERAYTLLFEEFGEEAWSLSRDALIAFMRGVDNTSARVGDQQAITFQALARQAGRGAVPVRAGDPARRRGSAAPAAGPGRSERVARPRGPNGNGTPDPARSAGGGRVEVKADANGSGGAGRGVQIHINLPVTDDSTVYDHIFRSLRRHLIDG